MKAALWGRTVGYKLLGNRVEIENAGNVFIYVSADTFDYLYFTLDEQTAALKEDCIDYTEISFTKPTYEYPDWFLNAWNDGDIYMNDDRAWFYDHNGEIAMAPGSVMLMNFKGDLMYMERNKFEKYYDTLEETQ